LGVGGLAVVVFALFVFDVQAKYSVARFVLKNGLQVVCIKKKSAPIIFFSIWYCCGSKNDAISKSGVAHYLEHMAFSSNKMEFSELLEDIGALKNAFTSINAICFHEVVPKENIEMVFIHEAIRMVSLNFDDDVFQSEKGAILEERSMRVDNDPGGAMQESALANIFNRETGVIGIVGWKHEIETIIPEDLQKFHDKWFAPNNALIVISGDFELDHIKKLAEKFFGKIPSKQIEKPRNVSDVFPKTTVCLKEIRYGSPKSGSLAVVEYVYRVPFSSRENLRKSIALDIAIMALNQPAFFVKKMLKDVINCATHAAFGYVDRVFAQDIVIFEVSASSIEAARDSENMWRYLRKKLLHTGVSQSELDAVKRQYLISLAYKKDDIIKMSNHFGWLLIGGYSLEEIQEIDDIVQSITAKECNDLLQDIFSQEPRAISRIVPKGYDRE
jgi:zinc protease